MTKGKYKWTAADLKGPATEPSELVAPDGTLCGITLRTLEGAWGNYNMIKRIEMGNRILKLLNDEQ